MPEFDRERLTLFPVGDEYLFSHYFERRDLFEELKDYYDHDAYRYAVPREDFETVTDILQEAHYEPVVVEDLEPYCVLKERYTEHADILRESVLHWQRRGYNFFLMSDDLAVAEALERGATRLEATDMVLGL